MKKMLVLSLATIVLITLSSCCGCRSSKSKNPYNLTSNGWKLTEMNGAKIISDSQSYTITFDEAESKIFGMAECNRYFADYELSEVRRVSFSGAGATKMMCPDQEREDQYLKTLNEINSYTVDGDTLLLLKDGEVVLIYEPFISGSPE
ncbi:MAG: META domain-containing protein [Rikenellaceae bacterium]